MKVYVVSYGYHDDSTEDCKVFSTLEKAKKHHDPLEEYHWITAKNGLDDYHFHDSAFSTQYIFEKEVD
jgi:hypothetical protein